MKKIGYSLLICMSLLATGNAIAQCPAGRYNSYMFGVTKSTVTYSTPFNLAMDIYEPMGDTYPARPLVILAHGGSFISGNKTDDLTIDSLCERFARRGYVTASIDYRLGNLFEMVTDSSKAIETVIKAISDGKAAVRYFVKDAATTNTYRIDTNNIYVGGNSAGAVLYMHVNYLGSLSECPSYIQTAMLANGGFEGNSGNDGYATKTKAVINLAGALNLTSFIDPFDKPSVNAQGTTDDVVPYNCGYPLSSTVHVNLCGLGQLEPVYTAQNVYHWSMLFPGDGHVPWSSSPAKLNSVDSLVRDFLYSIVCLNAGAVEVVGNTATISIYPNPANDLVTIDASDAINDISVYDQMGRKITTVDANGKNTTTVNTGSYPRGIYFVRILLKDDNIPPVVKRLIVE